MVLKDMSRDELEALKAKLKAQYEEFKSRGLSLNMARGKPSPDQLDMADGMLDTVSGAEAKTGSSVDCRNYGLVDGLPEMKQIFAELFEVETKNIIVGGNSSLNMMYDCVAQGLTIGYGCGPWKAKNGGKLKFLCPAPGYDRHFGVTEALGFELVTVNMKSDGPDMDEVEKLVKDPDVKGIWCVPKYSNPTGITYSDEVVKRFAALRPVAEDFRIFWDNSYMIHDLYDEKDSLLNLFEECEKAGNPDLPLMFTSTSKVSYPGGGVACIAASDNNIALIKKRTSAQTIGPDKINQLRHLIYFKNKDGILAHMRRHAEKIRPKFAVVLNALEAELSGKGIAQWTEPNGGYFISLDVMDGCASEIVALCKAAGMQLTPAGATYPYGKDPRDRNIRIAPTYPPVEELKPAMELLCICVLLACVEKLTEEK